MEYGDNISRQAAIDALFDWEMTYDWDDHCREEDPKPAYIVSPSDVIERLPSAQSIIRCKDCKHFHENVWGNEIGLDDWPIIVAHEACDAWGGEWTQSCADGYCHMAERRTDE